jgi:prepilin-type processing-associated H-X9-DG protein
MSNLRQIGTAMTAYATDNEGWFPGPGVGYLEHEDDWVYWQPTRDVKQSRIYRYLGNNLAVLKCPAGVPEREPVSSGGRVIPPYPFSYSVNVSITGYGAAPGRPRHWGTYSYAKLSQVVAPSQKVLALEEDTTGINDGVWWPEGDYVTIDQFSVSVVHEQGRDFGGKLNDTRFFVRGRGPVLFVDGHVDLLDRKSLYDPRYSDPKHSP